MFEEVFKELPTGACANSAASWDQSDRHALR